MPAQSRAPIILLTRPADQAARFEVALRGLGVEVVTSPLMAPRFLRPQVTGRDWVGVVFTSAIGVQAAVGMDVPKVAYCVGDQTAREAEAAGFVARSAGGNADDLVRVILDQVRMGPLLHICGRDTRGEVAGRLTAAGVECEAVVAYVQEEQLLSEAAVDLLGQAARRVVAPVFSPRTGDLLAAECLRVGVAADLEIVAISAEAGRAFAGRVVTVAARPEAAAMVEAIASRVNTAPPP